MPRSTIAAALALLMLLAPAASARPIDGPKDAAAPLVMPERISDTGGETKVMPERITDHPGDVQTSSLAGTTDATTAALAQERYYASHGAAEPSGRPADGDTPWAAIALGVLGSGLIAAGLTAMTRRSRMRARVAA